MTGSKGAEGRFLLCILVYQVPVYIDYNTEALEKHGGSLRSILLINRDRLIHRQLQVEVSTARAPDAQHYARWACYLRVFERQLCRARCFNCRAGGVVWLHEQQYYAFYIRLDSYIYLHAE